MKRVFLIAAAVVLLWGCGSHDNTARQATSLLAETRRQNGTTAIRRTS